MARSQARATEVDAYIFIKETLKELGWDIRNPARSQGGRVYTQNECLDHPEIHTAFGQDRPENVVQVSETAFWVIEAKREQRELDKAVAEAEEYARRIILYAAIIGSSANVWKLSVNSVRILVLCFVGS